MKKINYVTFSSIPSSLPSSLQIIKTCESISKCGYKVTLLKPGTGYKKISISKYYNLQSKVNIKEFHFFNTFPRGAEFYLYSLCCLFFILRMTNTLTITRNYFVCFLLLLFRQDVILEIHHDITIEGRINKFLIKFLNILNDKKIIKIIAISNAVKKLFVKKYNVSSNKIIVLPSGSSIKINFTPKLKFNKRLKIGYFGSISSSKGINTFIRLSKIDIENDYFIFGGSKEIISKKRMANNNRNLFLKNNIPYTEIPKVLLTMDILTLPYTKIVKSSGDVDDISKYTSPLKLFDYLAVGKMIITSDLKVLREIINFDNAFFVKNFENIYEWKKNIILAKNNMKKIFIIGKNNFKLSKKYDHDKRVRNYFNQ